MRKEGRAISTHDTDTTAVLNALKDTLDEVSMDTPVSQIVSAGRTRRRRRLTGYATGAAAITALALTVGPLSQPFSQPFTAPSALGTGANPAHLSNVAFTMNRHTDGTIHVTWDKQRYFKDRAGLERALRAAGFPVLIKEGVFCAGPNDDTTLHHGIGPGVRAVMQGVPTSDGKAEFVFRPAAMPAGKQLFIGYLSAAQLAVTGGAPGSVERLVSTTEALTCTTQAPPAEPRNDRADNPGAKDKSPAKDKPATKDRAVTKDRPAAK